MKTWSKTVKTLCLSTGESELAAVVRGGAEGIGMRSVLEDLGYSVGVSLESDATAAIGMTQRLGLGSVRHLSTADLWIQQRVRRREIKLSKVHGTENSSDMLTKVLAADQNRYLLSKIGCMFTEGRPEIAPMRVCADKGVTEQP